MESLKQMVMTFDEVDEAFAEDAAKADKSDVDKPQVPDYKGTIPTPEGYTTIRVKFQIDPMQYRSPNYVPLQEGVDPKDVKMPTGMIGVEEVMEEGVSELDKTGNKKDVTAQDAMATALMEIATQTPAVVVEDETTDSLMCNMCVPDDSVLSDSPCVAMDAKTAKKPKVRCKSTFKDCRAKNPLYCPYHGAALIKADIERQLRSMGVNGLVEVESGEDNGEWFFMAVTVPDADKDKAERMIDALLKTPGFKTREETSAESVGVNMTELDTYFDIDVLRSDKSPNEQDDKEGDNKDEQDKSDDGNDKDKGKEEDKKKDEQEENKEEENDEGNPPPPPPLPDEKDKNKEEENKGNDGDKKDEEDKPEPQPPPPPPPPEPDKKQEETDKAVSALRDTLDGIKTVADKMSNQMADIAGNAPEGKFDALSQRVEDFKNKLEDVSNSFGEMVEKKNEMLKNDKDSTMAAMNAHVLDLMLNSFRDKTIPRLTKEMEGLREEVDHARVENDDAEADRVREETWESFGKAMESMEDAVFGDVAKLGIPVPEGLTYTPLGLESGLINMLAEAENYNGDLEDKTNIWQALGLTEAQDKYHDAVGELEEAKLAIEDIDKITQGKTAFEMDEFKNDILGAVLGYKVAAMIFKDKILKASKALRDAKDRRAKEREESQKKREMLDPSLGGGIQNETMTVNELLKGLLGSDIEKLAGIDGSDKFRTRSAAKEGLFADVESDKDGKITGLSITLPNRATMNFNSVEAFRNAHARLFGYNRKDIDSKAFDGVPIEDVLKSDAIRSLLPSQQEIDMEMNGGELAGKVSKAEADRSVAKDKREHWRWHRSTENRKEAKSAFDQANDTGMQLAEAALSWFGMHGTRNHGVRIQEAYSKTSSDIGTAESGVASLQKLMPRIMPESVNGEIGVVKGKPGARAFCGWNKVIHPATFETLDVFVHEAGHAFEFLGQRVKDRCVEFLRYRTRGEELQSLRKLTGNQGYKADERAMKDKFFKPYCGKYYPQYQWTEDGRAYTRPYSRWDKQYLERLQSEGKIDEFHLTSQCTEILSMGIQRLITDPIEFVREDPEYVSFVLGICHGAI